VSLVVNEVGEVMDIEPELIEPTPDTLDAGIQPYIDGVYKLKNELMLILNVSSAVDVTEQV